MLNVGKEEISCVNGGRGTKRDAAIEDEAAKEA